MNQSQTTVGEVSTIWRYAVKSMKGEMLKRVEILEQGILGDRAFALTDSDTGKIASAKMPKLWGDLLNCSAIFCSPPNQNSALPPVRITLPSGDSYSTDNNCIDKMLSNFIGRSVEITALRPDTISLDRLDPLEEEESILDIGDIMMEGRFSDYAAVHIVTDSTLNTLSELYPDVCFDERRFRPNLVVKCQPETKGFIENEWVGRTILIGDDIQLKITDPTPRCAVPTLAQNNSISKDPTVLRAIVEQNKLPVPLLENEVLPCVGIYAFITHGGVVREGDTVTVA